MFCTAREHAFSLDVQDQQTRPDATAKTPRRSYRFSRTEAKGLKGTPRIEAPRERDTDPHPECVLARFTDSGVVVTLVAIGFLSRDRETQRGKETVRTIRRFSGSRGGVTVVTVRVRLETPISKENTRGSRKPRSTGSICGREAFKTTTTASHCLCRSDGRFSRLYFQVRAIFLTPAPPPRRSHVSMGDQQDRRSLPQTETAERGEGGGCDDGAVSSRPQSLPRERSLCLPIDRSAAANRRVGFPIPKIAIAALRIPPR